MKFKFLKAAFTFVVLAVSSFTNATVITGSVSGEDNEWGYIQFDHTGGTLEIDMWSNGFTGGSNEGIVDGYLYLFSDNGSSMGALTGTFIGYDDDGSLDLTSGGADGSTSSLDSFLRVSDLNLGSYILLIGNCCHGGNETDPRTNTSSFVTGEFRDYQLTFSQDVLVTAIDGVSAVPEPTTLTILALGLMGLVSHRFKKQS